MEVRFATRQLKLCYSSEKEAVRAWRPQVARKYISRIKILLSVKEFRELYTFASLRLHGLMGPRAGQYSMMLHDRSRLIVRLDQEKGVIRVEEVTHHYGD